MDDDFVQQLLLEETNLLDSMQSGPEVFASYPRTLKALSNALSAAMKTGDVGTETLSFAHSVASRISSIASCLLDVIRRADLVTAQFQRDRDAMLHKMATLDLNAFPKSLQPDSGKDTCSLSNSSTPTHSAESSSAPFLAIAHQWLLDNLHNPYPTAEVKTWMATVSSCQVSSINSWFINARRRIGWTTLCRVHFSSCRADMVDAAYRALVEEDLQRALPSELRYSFIAMKVAAEGLYSSTLTRSVLAGDLDAIVKSATKGNNKESPGVRKCSKVDQENLTKVARDPYPSPDPSATASPVPVLSDFFADEGEEDDAAPPIIAVSKRRRSSIEPDNRRAGSRPIKRLRASTTPRTSLPSPSSSIDVIDMPFDKCSPVSSSVHPSSAETNRVLPPRLSDADATGTPKHPDDSTATPHFHTVSGPLPYFHLGNDYSIDEWFNTNFDDLFAIPPPIEATEPDFSASWEVELFKDYSIPENLKCATKYPPAPTVVSAIAAPTSVSNIDSLLQSIGSDTFTTASNVLPSEITGTPSTTPLDPSIPEISQINIDWTSLFDDTQSHGPIAYSTFSQYPVDSQPLPEIDLSMLQLPCVVPAVNPQYDFPSRQAKLHQLLAMQEAVRRMEQELWSGGVVL